VYFGQPGVTVMAAPATTDDWCDEVCNETASCTESCLYAVGDNPAEEYTCGTYGGGPSEGTCNGDGCADECSWWSVGPDVCWWENEETTCEGFGLYGFCGDNACSPAQGETCGNCPEDCSICTPPPCGDEICEAGETFRSCPADCAEPGGDYCGNGQCGSGEDGESCPEDCTLLHDWCGTGHACATGWECLDNVCSWESDPQYQCCGESADLCLQGPMDCPPGSTCRVVSSGNSFHVCKPNFSGS